MAETIRSKNSPEWKSYATTPIVILVVTIPISMFLWASNRTFQIIKHSEDEHIPPTRWLASIFIPIGFVIWGLKRKTLGFSGAAMGFIIAFAMTLANYCFLTCLAVFFVTSSKATKFRIKDKRKIADEMIEGARRNWIQVLCNSGMAPQLAVLYIFEIGVGQRPINFAEDFRASWFALGVMSAFACGNADTWASELGTVLSSSDPRLITTFQKVPRGANGGVTCAGTILSAIGGLLVGAGYYLTIVLSVNSDLLAAAPPQWPVVVLGAAAGLFGSLLDSLLGATCQYSGVQKKTGMVVEQPGPDVVYVCGRRILDNHSVNLLSNIITAIVMPRVANMFWPYH